MLFEVGKTDGKNASYKHLEHVITRRKRLTDEIGWLDRRRIGILLPETSAKGARKFAGEVREAIADTTPPSAFTVYTYPSQFSPGDISHPGEPATTRTQSGERPVEGLEQLFIRGIPAWKRAMDIVGALTGIILFSPIMLAVTIAIKLTSKGPILFKQQRAGLGEKPFTFYKFRSMVNDAEAQKEELIKFNFRTGPAFKMKNDPRVTPVGRFIRKWSLDELPQFFNVLKGEMSLVGPRPLPVKENGECDQWHWIRLEVKPGITCLWQISARHGSDFNDWVRLDVEYVRKLSLMLDLKILLITLPAVVSRKGAY